jgi:general stress protein 26
MTPKHSKEEMLELLEAAEPAYLATVDAEGFPHTRALFNLHNKDQWPELAAFLAPHAADFAVYFGTNTSSAKVAHVRANPKACAYYCDPKEYRGLMLQGTLEIVDDGAVKRALWYDWWTKYYPGGVDDPDYTVLQLRPALAKYYAGMSVTALELPEGK